jgi:NAD(P)-dependent dehydrogenase (short-subunit alcohol dehydrogenase family)
MTRLNNKVALITGGNSGMGLETARRFVAEGAKVIITGRRQKELDAAVKSIGGSITGIQGDVSSLKDLDRLYAEIKKTHGHLDIIFANAGLAEFAPVEHITEDHYSRQFDVNVKGVVFTIQKGLPLLRDGGSIILNASVAGSSGFEAFSIYSAMKAAVRSFARGWANDLKARKIRVNAISPGPIDTPIFDKIEMTQEQIDGFTESVKAQVPLGRFGSSQEIANAVLFLASDESSYINGIELTIDGGMTQV